MRVSLIICLISALSLAGFPKSGASSLHATANSSTPYSISNLNISSQNNTQTAHFELTVTVKNVNGSPKSSARVKLYNSDASILINTLTTNTSGEATFTDLSDGIYNYEVYYKGANNSPLADNTEFWGGSQVTINGIAQSIIFTRSQPYISAEASFTPSILGSGQAASGKFLVKSTLSYAVDSYVAVWVDQNKSSSWDYTQNISAKIIHSGSAAAFPFTVTPTDTGTYHCYAFVYTKVNGCYIITDQYTWYPIFMVSDFMKIGNAPISQIQWSGYSWNVKSGVAQGPGPNDWLADSSTVWVDREGQLHLKIRRIGSKWYCASIHVQSSFGYGDYIFEISSNVENLDKNVVLGLFTYETDLREIDIEFSRWGNHFNPIGWYSVQPAGPGSSYSFALNLHDQLSSHMFQWSSSKIYFQSYSGHYFYLPEKEHLISGWTYTGSQIPPAGDERLVLNLWLYKGVPPSDLKEVEVVIKSFSFRKVD